MSNPIDLFLPVAQDAALHPQLRALRDSPHHASVRALMNGLYAAMGDPNGGFVRNFQGSEIHARLFELARFAYLGEARFSIDRSHESPDFIASRDGCRIAVEATTANCTNPGIVARRRGFCCVDSSPTEFLVREFEYLLGTNGTPTETWAEGVTLFLNPNATAPLPARLLPASSTFAVREEELVREFAGFHPVVSFMEVAVSEVAREV